ncbi:MAG TPA: class I SAM-dependent methyltransferase [Phycisphaerae bacterium]|nr:class I SAM-dependent methyltransferase [Phycisphaerae bacterium]
MSKIRKIRKHYVPRIAAGRENYDILDWASAQSQKLRFEVLLRHVDLEGKSLLDVGCGLGDLTILLRDRGLDVRYTGVDVLEKMLEKARRANPGVRFVLGDIFATGPGRPLARERFDVVFSSGTMNLNLGNNLEFLRRALPRMLHHTGEVLVANFLHSRETPCDPKYFHYDPADVIEILEPLCPRDNIQLVDDYLANDFTLICRPNSRR